MTKQTTATAFIEPTSNTRLALIAFISVMPKSPQTASIISPTAPPK